VPSALKKFLQAFKDYPPTPELSWTLTASRLPCFVKISPHTPFFRPYCVFTLKQLGAGSFNLLDRSLDPTLWAPPHSCDALPPLEKVLEVVAELVRRVGMSPASLLVAQPVYAAGLQQLLSPLGMRVAAAEAGDAAALEDALRPAAEALGNDVVKTAPRMSFVPNWPPQALPGRRLPLLRDSSPRLRDAHLRAFFALANDLVALQPWGPAGLSENVVLRVYFPGGAEPAPGYKLPPGDVLWVHINGQNFLREIERARQAAPPGGPILLPKNLDRDFGLRVFTRRSDADAFLLAPVNAILKELRDGRKPPPHPRAELPCVARPNPLEARCLVCGGAGKRCEKCGGVGYCGMACAKHNAEAHKAVCVPPAKVVPGLPPRVQVAAPTLKVRMFEVQEAPLGEAEEMGRVGGALSDGEDVPLALMETRDGFSRPPLLDLTRLIRALGVVTTFLRDRENMIRSSIPRPSEETFVPFSSALRRLGGA
jgi:hypothetical protein